MPEQDKDKITSISSGPEGTVVKTPSVDGDDPQYFFGEHLVGLDPSELHGNLIVIEGLGSRSLLGIDEDKGPAREGTAQGVPEEPEIRQLRL